MNALAITIVVLHCLSIIAGACVAAGVAPVTCGIIVAASSSIGIYLQNVARGDFAAVERENRLLKLCRPPLPKSTAPLKAFPPVFDVQFSGQPKFQPVDGPNRLFDVLDDFGFTINGIAGIVPKGFRTDFASIPGPLEVVLENDDPRILRPSLVHDLLCKNKGILGGLFPHYSSRDAARILVDGMKTCGASDLLRHQAYIAVDTFGPHWPR